MVYDLAKQGYSESIMTKTKQAVGAVLKMAAAKHYLDMVVAQRSIFQNKIPLPKQGVRDTLKIRKMRLLKGVSQCTSKKERRSLP